MQLTRSAALKAFSIDAQRDIDARFVAQRPATERGPGCARYARGMAVYNFFFIANPITNTCLCLPSQILLNYQLILLTALQATQRDPLFPERATKNREYLFWVMF